VDSDARFGAGEEMSGVFRSDGRLVSVRAGRGGLVIGRTFDCSARRKHRRRVELEGAVAASAAAWDRKRGLARARPGWTACCNAERMEVASLCTAPRSQEK
jgi:hypothetical protein